MQCLTASSPATPSQPSPAFGSEPPPPPPPAAAFGPFRPGGQEGGGGSGARAPPPVFEAISRRFPWVDSPRRATVAIPGRSTAGSCAASRPARGSWARFQLPRRRDGM